MMMLAKKRWLGYRRKYWPRLRRDLQRAALSDRSTLERTTEFGQVYRLPTMLRGPAGRVASLVTIWIVEVGSDRPRLITVFPGE
jgi:hypothetical protein